MKGSMPRNITSPQLSPDWMKTPITKVRSSPGRLQQDLPAKWTHESRPSDGTKSNHEHKFVTVTLLDSFRAGLSNINVFVSAESHEFTPRHLGCHTWRQVRDGGRRKGVGKAALARWWRGFMWHFYWHSKLWICKASSTYLLAIRGWLLMLLSDRLLRGFAYLLQ